MEETKKCPKCKEDINKSATKCPKCQSDLRNWFNRHPIITIILVLILISSFIDTLDTIKEINGVTNQVSTNNLLTSTGEVVPEVIKNWQYSEKINEMDGIKTKYATNISINKINLSFPYGDTSSKITLRKKGNQQTEVMFSVTQGQILDYNKKARIKFDDGEPISVSITGTSDGSSELVFLGSENTIIQKLKTAKNLMIEIEYFKDGVKLSKFNVEGLEF